MNSSSAVLTVHIYESELHAIMEEASKYPSTETGGDLFGTFTHGNMPVIWLISVPGPDARRTRTLFQQDVRYLTTLQEVLYNRFSLQHIGTWHSHHELNIPAPSAGDIDSMQQYGRHHYRQTALEIIVSFEGGAIVPRAYFYPDAQNAKLAKWKAATFRVIEGTSPVRQQIGNNRRAFPTDSDGHYIDAVDAGMRSAEDRRTKQQTNQNNRIPDQGDSRVPDTALKLPSELEAEIANLDQSKMTIDLEKRGNDYMVMMWLSDFHMIAVAIRHENRQLSLLEASTINSRANTSDDITEELKVSGIPEHKEQALILWEIWNYVTNVKPRKTGGPEQQRSLLETYPAEPRGVEKPTISESKDGESQLNDPAKMLTLGLSRKPPTDKAIEVQRDLDNSAKTEEKPGILERLGFARKKKETPPPEIHPEGQDETSNETLNNHLTTVPRKDGG